MDITSKKWSEVFKDASKVDGPVLVHCLTQKGRGYLPAERHPARFHGAEPFDIETGLPSNKKEKAAYTGCFFYGHAKIGRPQRKCRCHYSSHAGLVRD